MNSNFQTPVENSNSPQGNKKKTLTFVLLGLIVSLIVVIVVLIFAINNDNKSTAEKNNTEISRKNDESDIFPAEKDEYDTEADSGIDEENINENSDSETVPDYTKNIPFSNKNQHWAFINLLYGPYDNWEDNRVYYIDKYFSYMSAEEKDAIKHYEGTDGFGHYYLIVPTHKATITISEARLNDSGEQNHSKTICTVENGIPFSVQMMDPPGDYNAILGLKDSDGRELFIFQNSSDDPEREFENESILDLTEY